MNTSSSNKTIDIPYKEYKNYIGLYSPENQDQAIQYKEIIESNILEKSYDEYSNLEDASMGKLNTNIPVYKNKISINVDNKQVDTFKHFWNFKQHAGTVFTDYRSAGVSANYEDASIRDLPLKSLGLNKSTPELTMSNTNNIRNNLQNYGKSFLTTTNLLNNEAFYNGVSYQSSSSSPYRESIQNLYQIQHSNFNHKINGDKYSRNFNQMRVDLPSNFAQTLMTSWQYINPICVEPNLNQNLDWLTRLQFGTLNLDALLYIGKSCLTSDFNVIPPGYNTPVDVFEDHFYNPPITNSEYFVKGKNYYKKEGKSGGLYCSKNTNFVAMPINHKFPNLDTSINVKPGNNSIALGMIMDENIKKFINKELFNFNKKQLLKGLLFDNSNNQMKINNLKNMYPEINTIDMTYNTFKEETKYKYLYDQQKLMHDLAIESIELKHFVNSLNIIKIGGTSTNNAIGHIILDQIKYPMSSTGVYLLLPSMMSEDLFNLKENSEGSCTGSTPELKRQSCCFQGPSGEWNNDASVVPEWSGTENLNKGNNFFTELNIINPGCGINPYNSPNTF